MSYDFHICYSSDFQFFSSHGTHKLLKFWSTPKKIIFAYLTKKIGIILIHSYQMASVVLAVVIFLCDNLREKRSVPLTSQVFKILVVHQCARCSMRAENRCAGVSCWGQVWD